MRVKQSGIILKSPKTFSHTSEYDFAFKMFATLAKSLFEKKLIKAVKNNKKGQSKTPVCSTDPGKVNEEIPMQEEHDKIRAGNKSSLFEVNLKR